jgi:hypothetical protein
VPAPKGLLAGFSQDHGLMLSSRRELLSLVAGSLKELACAS